MNRSIRFAIVMLGLALFCSESQAQFQNPNAPRGQGFGRPRISPYLNLLRGGDPASNFYLGTRRQRRQNATNQTFRGAILELDRRAPTVSEDLQGYFAPLGTTGHRTAFQNYGAYYSQGVGPLAGPPRFVGTPSAGQPQRR